MSRYQRQIILPGFGTEAQQKLLRAKVLVIGVGGLGCPALQTLATAGIGTLGLMDADVIDISNLHRQILFGEHDLGKLKVHAAIQRLQQVNSSCIYHGFPFALLPENAIDTISQFDIIIDGTDDITSRYLINDVCALLQKPLVYASLYQFQGQLSVFHYGESPNNLRYLFPEIPNSESVMRCTEAGVLGTLTSIMGTMQAQEAIKIISGIGNVLSGKLLVYDALQNEVYQLNIQENSSIFRAKNASEILQKNYTIACENKHLSIQDIEVLHNLIMHENAILVDVRNKGELPKFNQFPVLEIPLNSLSDRISELETADTIIFFCQSGIRSRQALNLVQPIFKDKKLFHLESGIKILKHGSK